MTYDAVVFDNDGVLTHPTPVERLRAATVEGFAAAGVEDPAPEHVDRMTFHVTPEDLQTASDAYGVDPETLWYERDAAFSRTQIADMEAGEKPLYPDYDAVPAIDAPRGIVSTNQHRTIEAILDFYEIRGDFATHYGREMEPASLHKKKPNAHYLDRALADLGVAPEDALFVGDSQSDVEAAHNAGTDSAFLWRDHRADYDLGVEPDHELDSLRDLQTVL
ncbi:HAD family hydrolase [Halobacterium litoreum]|uniref:HAD family hydrolase n=1 Tax=Halobacterium litoreum TaxID=2039234 RepID=A0ABD5ND29_9EURY|nr:HAD family hydrolase [Halobacterium litoreum]UHH13924.1 HAD family hydrolase [Halobacterium litoreum]